MKAIMADVRVAPNSDSRKESQFKDLEGLTETSAPTLLGLRLLSQSQFQCRSTPYCEYENQNGNQLYDILESALIVRGRCLLAGTAYQPPNGDIPHEQACKHDAGQYSCNEQLSDRFVDCNSIDDEAD